MGGFATRADALKAREKVLARLRPGGRAATITLAELVDEYLEMHQAEQVTIAKLRWLLAKATAALGDVRLAELSPKDVYAWRLTVPEGHRFEAAQALRQVLNRAIAWGLLDPNPAKRGVPNAPRRYKEKRPFDSWEQIEAVAERLLPVYGPMVVFAAATGLGPSELFALEQRDIDRRAASFTCDARTQTAASSTPRPGSATERCRYRRSRSRRLACVPASEGPLLFANSRGGYIDFRSFGRRHWKPAQVAAGVDPLRHLYDLRHTYATFALRAGVSVFAVSRFMGSSIAMIDYHYGHLARDSREHAVSLLDALAVERAVDAGWTSPAKPANSLTNRVSKTCRARARRSVDARWTSRPRTFASPVNKRS